MASPSCLASTFFAICLSIRLGMAMPHGKLDELHGERRALARKEKHGSHPAGISLADRDKIIAEFKEKHRRHPAGISVADRDTIFAEVISDGMFGFYDVERADTFSSPGYPLLPEITKCKREFPSLQMKFPHEMCHGHASATTATATPTLRWGLSNSTTCPKSPFLTDQLPALHKQWKSEGKVLRFCVQSRLTGGLGNVLMAFTQAFLASVLLERAFVNHCDSADARFSDVTRANFEVYFDSPHIAWQHSNGEDDKNSTVLDLAKVAPLNASSAKTAVVRGLVGLWGGFLKDPDNFFRIGQTLGSEFVSHPNFYGCLLRYLLMPSQRIEQVINALPNKPAVQDDGLFSAIALHVRVGDSTFISDNEKSKWHWANELNHNAMVSQPLETLHCLTKRSHVGTHCLQTIVLSDSQEVLDCAESVLDHPLITPGVPVHPLASSRTDLSDMNNTQKIFLDWWLLARSYAVSLPDGHDKCDEGDKCGSTFFNQALRFRDATADRATQSPC